MFDKDLNLYHAFIFGDPTATETMIAQYTDKLIRLAYLYTKDSAAAEDIVEDSFALMLVKEKVFEDASDVKAYLYRIVRNKSIDYLRRKRKKVPIEDVEEILHTPSFERIIERNDQFRVLYEGMAKLPSQYSNVLYLAYFDNFPVEEICKITGKSKKQIYNLLARAKASLKTLLKGASDSEK